MTTVIDKWDRILEIAEGMNTDELLNILDKAISYLDDGDIAELLSYMTDD